MNASTIKDLATLCRFIINKDNEFESIRRRVLNNMDSGRLYAGNEALEIGTQLVAYTDGDAYPLPREWKRKLQAVIQHYLDLAATSFIRPNLRFARNTSGTHVGQNFKV